MVPKITNKWLTVFTVVVVFSLVSAVPGNAQVVTYEITLENLTNSAPNSGQTFSPPTFFTQDGSINLWTMGEGASDPIRQVAEEGNNVPLLQDLALAGSAVGDTFVLSGPQFPGTKQSFFLTTDLSTHSILSSVWMLGRTNDGFTGQNALNLAAITSSFSVDLVGLDAGTEVNNELAAFMPALGGVFNDPESGVIALHSGIVGDADAPASWNFSGSVARLSVAVVPEASSLVLVVGALFVTTLVRRKRN